ncbi:hypothetical protein LI012_12720 [Caldibacillus thermoamylovorans]|uniref:hypothetical protein n=1 Tax=Caldibacillus thermoamylovorans TaxID=35841 RepID=UPI001D095D4F|nr:hypothetical protein [Caldibacillus thermoamylovorans]MCB5935639.1 hypothetical protein [Bacillus sp. DFI.2.34]MCB7077675.1 hypothetical protein [Caldibacillus thermoamylovorans]
MEQVSFIVEAKKYFENDGERFWECDDTDLCLVTIDFENREASFVWYPEDENPANFPTEDDDFEGVVKLWEELGRPE